MQSMVKLHDLLDLVEPSWKEMAEASTSGLLRDNSMEMDDTIWNHDKEDAYASASLGEANLGLG